MENPFGFPCNLHECRYGNPKGFVAERLAFRKGYGHSVALVPLDANGHVATERENLTHKDD